MKGLFTASLCLLALLRKLRYFKLNVRKNLKYVIKTAFPNNVVSVVLPV